ncbi:DJ-1/PfpI family protein [Novosphingobium rosa]|uniref:DJ-1/PfpI family protein n=1 Tax=Novosphingobium rosa TaxID=76978 RepID=UPI000A07858A|nr:DJ-1/PfpI family protein [Novosphingobium rosa]
MRGVLIIETDGFDDLGLTCSMQAFHRAGIETVLASPEAGEITGCKGAELGLVRTLGTVNPNKFDALVLPGGQVGADGLSIEHKAIELVRDFLWGGKPVAAACDGLWLLAVANVLKGRVVTAAPTGWLEFGHAGAQLREQEIVVDGNLITSQGCGWGDAFSRALIWAVRKRDIDEGR